MDIKNNVMRDSFYFKLRRFLGMRFIAMKVLVNEYFLLARHMGSTTNLYNNQKKLRARLIMNAHSIEKGLSLKNIRLGYGKAKILLLLKDVTHYYELFKDDDILIFCLSIIDEYIKYNKENEVIDNDIIKAYTDAKAMLKISLDDSVYLRGGSFKTSREKIHCFGKIDYENFIKNRHSIRNFTGNDIDFDLVYKALELAEYTPSACNRQPWGNHVFVDKEKISKVLELQGGANQFKDDLSCVILVTSKYSSFFGYEHHQPYVNGGLYAMNLMLALHSLGLGTTPLNMGVSLKKLKGLEKLCNLEKDEVPILMIGVGEIAEELFIATSGRFSYKEYTKKY